MELFLSTLDISMLARTVVENMAIIIWKIIKFSKKLINKIYFFLLINRFVIFFEMTCKDTSFVLWSVSTNPTQKNIIIKSEFAFSHQYSVRMKKKKMSQWMQPYTKNLL